MQYWTDKVPVAAWISIFIAIIIVINLLGIKVSFRAIVCRENLRLTPTFWRRSSARSSKSCQGETKPKLTLLFLCIIGFGSVYSRLLYLRDSSSLVWSSTSGESQDRAESASGEFSFAQWWLEPGCARPQPSGKKLVLRKRKVQHADTLSHSAATGRSRPSQATSSAETLESSSVYGL